MLRFQLRYYWVESLILVSWEFAEGLLSFEINKLNEGISLWKCWDVAEKILRYIWDAADMFAEVFAEILLSYYWDNCLDVCLDTAEILLRYLLRCEVTQLKTEWLIKLSLLRLDLTELTQQLRRLLRSELTNQLLRWNFKLCRNNWFWM